MAIDHIFGCCMIPKRSIYLKSVFSKYYGGIGAAETEAVRKHGVELCLTRLISHDVKAGTMLVKLVNIDGGGNEAVLHHEQGENKLIDARST